MKKIILVLLLIINCNLFGQNLKRYNKQIIDENNNEVILRGAGLGGWMLQEPYMFNYTGAANAQYEFREKLVLLVGQDNTDNFFNSWRENFVTQQDVDSIASWGFNSIRLPMHYELFTYSIQNEPVSGENTWLETGFEMVDQLLDWCEANELYLILDLHAAPGGQGYGSDINDYNPNYPSLWESEENQNKTIALWGEIADRYKDEPWIGGYDLLNETHWSLGTNELRNFYIQVTNSIRQYDNEHIIFIEGNGYANDFSGLTPPWDDNMVYSFHKYWSYNDSNALDWVLDIKNQYNVPLWLGESGENSNQWFRDAIKLTEGNDIGWAWWPWKKIESISAPLSISSNSNYESIVSYFQTNENPPSVNNAVLGLTQLTQDILISNTHYQKDVIDAMIRQPTTDETIPYADHNIPGTIHLSDYDMGIDGIAYSDKISGTYQINTDEFTAWNSGWKYRNDGVDIETNSDSETNGYHIGFTEDQEWVIYTTNIESSGFYDIVSRYSAEQAGGKIILYSNSVEVTDEINLYSSGGFNNFVNKLTPNIYLNEGENKIKLKIIGDISFNISTLQFFESTEEFPEFDVLLSNTLDDQKSVKVLLNHPITNQELNIDSFDLKLNNLSTTIVSVEVDPNNAQVIYIEAEDYMSFEDNITISYLGDGLVSIFDSYIYTITNYPVQNNLSLRELIPGKIQAEDYSYQEGLDTEITNDAFGGLNIGYTDAGDFADYLVAVNNTGNYNVTFRIASEWQSGMIQLQLISDDSAESLGYFTIPVTGGWQTWNSSTYQINMEAGLYKLRMKVIQPGFNLNWIDFEYIEGSMTVDDLINDQGLLFPNPSSNLVSLKFLDDTTLNAISIIDMLGREVKTIDFKKLQTNVVRINISDISEGNYILFAQTNHGVIKKILIKSPN